MAEPQLPAVPPASPALEAFLSPLRVDRARMHALAGEFAAVFAELAAESLDQFLPTPISESLLRPLAQPQHGQYLAIDIGGTNLRVGFIELLGAPSETSGETPGETPGETSGGQRLRRRHERQWSILEHLKSENADSLFAWIGGCIAEVVDAGCASLGVSRTAPLPMGVTFSFPMEQDTLGTARLMSMGKGFAMTAKLDLGAALVAGYEQARAARDGRPPIAVAAIANDAVATLVSFVYEVPPAGHAAHQNQKAAMGLICGTGSNATLLLRKSKLHASKTRVATGTAADDPDERIAVNTEWSINGSARALHAVGLVSAWDAQLSASVEAPGFQPLEYMTAGRYLGELGRIMLLDYLAQLGVDHDAVPRALLRRFEPRNTMLLSRFRPGTDTDDDNDTDNVALLEAAFPSPEPFWTADMATALYHVSKAIEARAAAIIAAAIVGLLDCADELPAADDTDTDTDKPEPLRLVVGYTGGCITNFQDYLADCQACLDVLVATRYGSFAAAPVRVVLSPCHDGGIKGAGILVPAALARAAGE